MERAGGRRSDCRWRGNWARPAWMFLVHPGIGEAEIGRTVEVVGEVMGLAAG